MAKRLGLLLGGGALVVVFLVWMLVKGTDAVQQLIDPQPMLGLFALGVAWLCLLGGAALLVRTFFPRSEAG